MDEPRPSGLNHQRELALSMGHPRVIRIQAWLDPEVQVLSVGSFFPWFFASLHPQVLSFPAPSPGFQAYRTLSS